MGTFERLSVVVIGVILVMILVVAVVTWTEAPEDNCEPPLPPAEPNLSAHLAPDPLPAIPDPLPPIDDPFGPPVGPVPPPVEPAPVDPLPFNPEPALPDEPTPGPDPLKVVTHEVKTGETLSEIAAQHYPSHKYWKAIAEANGISGETIRKGQVLRIPSLEELGITNDKSKGTPPALSGSERPIPGESWKVRPGEDLISIAKAAYRNIERWPDIWLANRARLADPKDIQAGMVLELPR